MTTRNPPPPPPLMCARCARVPAPSRLVQVKAKYAPSMVDLFRETFCWLPLAHVLNGRIFVVHGGLFARDGVTLDDIRRIDRFRWGRSDLLHTPMAGLFCKLCARCCAPLCPGL